MLRHFALQNQPTEEQVRWLWIVDICHKAEIFQPGMPYSKVHHSEDVRRAENSTPEFHECIRRTDISLMLDLLECQDDA